MTTPRPTFAPLPVPGTRFAVHRSAVAAIHAALQPQTPQAFLDWDEGGGETAFTFVDGVAVVPVTGVLMQRSGFLTWLYGGTSYDTISQGVREALEAADVHAILLVVDSPGGQVDGVHELAAQILAARAVKPVVAYVTGAAASAAYWLASAAHDIWAAPTAVAGSIGVQVTITDWSEMDRKLGIETIDIVASQSPNKNRDPKTDEGRAQIQRMVDALADVFLANVATHRGVDPATVLAQFGQGDVFVGDHAVTAGLIDGIATLDEVRADLIEGGARFPAFQLPAVARIPGGIIAAGFAAPLRSTPTETDMAQRTKALATAATAEGDEDEKDKDESTAEGDDMPKDEEEESTAEGDEEKDDDASTAEGEDEEDEEEEAPSAAAERKRVLAILDLQTPGAESIVRACIENPRCSPGAAAIQLLKHSKATGHGYLQRAAEDTAGIAVGHAPGIKSEAAQADEATTAKGILSLVNKHSARRAAGRN